jgi:hypothetical protein
MQLKVPRSGVVGGGGGGEYFLMRRTFVWGVLDSRTLNGDLGRSGPDPAKSVL